ncbi:MAG: hypothetical protein GX259_06180 [Bacteroidales bacterium]|nr:hypothetical protein [Bacteroidales bacterium]
MKLKVILQVVLAIVIIALAYLIYAGIMAPVKFNNEMNARKNAVIERMKDIRTVEVMYLNMHGRYCSTFDSLIQFVEEGQLPLIKLTARPGDSTFTNPIRDTVGFISIKDSLFSKRENFKIEHLPIIPFSNIDNVQPDTFNLQVGTVDRSNVTLNVIEVFAANKYFLKGLDLEKFNIDPEDGVRFGSMSEPITDGNWE